MRINDIIEGKGKKTPSMRNFVAKNAGINRAATHKDRKMARNRGETEKHKGQQFKDI